MNLLTLVFGNPFQLFQPLLVTDVNYFRMVSSSEAGREPARDFFENDACSFWTDRG
jgi:hypothetical protein